VVVVLWVLGNAVHYASVGPIVVVGATVFLVMEDAVLEIARQIENTDVAGADFDALMNDINKCYDKIERLAHAWQYVQLFLICNSALVTVLFLLLGLGPRPTDPNHWFNVYSPPFVYVVLAGITLLIGVYFALLAPAKITAACDEIKHQLNHLRRDGDGLAKLDDLIRTEALERFVIELGEGGMGYNMLYARISYAFVCACTRLVASLCLASAHRNSSHVRTFLVFLASFDK
jgi:hypothetical protein